MTLLKGRKMNQNFDRLHQAKMLRDIFLSDNSEQLFQAFCGVPNHPDVLEMDLETQFNRYFVGPDTPIAAPYASVYLGEEEALMTQNTMHVRELYKIMGFKNSLKDKVPEDFLGLELDAYYQLLFLELEKDIPYLKELRLYFLCEHIQAWIFQFINKILQHQDKESTAVMFITNELDQFFQHELKLKGAIS
jgi:TorA maturation chaperone TorD